MQVYPDEQESAEFGWMLGWKDNKSGIFPANYVVKQREIYEPVQSFPGKSSASSAAAAAADMSAQEEQTSGMSKRLVV